MQRTGQVGGSIGHRINGSPERRFWPKVDKDGPVPAHRPDLGQCWIYSAKAQTVNGYAQFRWGNRMVTAHRAAWQLTVGPIAEGLAIDHLCRTRRCVRPSHLEPVTPAENSARSVGFNYAPVCRAGLHDMTDGNVRTTRTGIRVCRTCSPDMRPDLDTHCANGHEWTGEVKIVSSHGYSYTTRRCRACERAATRRHRERSRNAEG